MIFQNYLALYNAVSVGAAQVSRGLGTLLDTFAPLKKTGLEVEKIILDVVGLVFALAASPMWNKSMSCQPMIYVTTY